jgi:hypothetical protein
VIEGMPQGKALDIVQRSTIEGYDAVVKGSNDCADIAGADNHGRHRPPTGNEPRRFDRD